MLLCFRCYKAMIEITLQHWMETRPGVRVVQLGGGGAEKILGVAQIKFFLKSIAKTPQKNVYIPNYASWIRAVCLLSAHDSRFGGHVHSLAGRDRLLRCGSRFLPINLAVKTKKKVFDAKSLVRLGVHSCFSSLNRTLLTLKGGMQAIICGAQAPKCTPVAPGLLLSFRTKSTLRGYMSYLGGTQTVIWREHGPEMPPLWRRVWWKLDLCINTIISSP